MAIRAPDGANKDQGDNGVIVGNDTHEDVAKYSHSHFVVPIYLVITKEIKCLFFWYL